MNNAMKSIDKTADLCILKTEDELIIKPFHSGITHEAKSTIECGTIVSRSNKHLFDYRIANKTNSRILNSILNRRITLIDPMTNEVVLEFSQNRLPLLLKFFCKQHVRSLPSLFNEFSPIGSIQQKLAFAKIWYDIYNIKREHVVSLMLRKSSLRSTIQHRIREFEILDNDKSTTIGRIYPYSMNLEQTIFRHAVAMRIPKDMKIEIKATLLISALILKSGIR